METLNAVLLEWKNYFNLIYHIIYVYTFYIKSQFLKLILINISVCYNYKSKNVMNYKPFKLFSYLCSMSHWWSADDLLSGLQSVKLEKRAMHRQYFHIYGRALPMFRKQFTKLLVVISFKALLATWMVLQYIES